MNQDVIFVTGGAGYIGSHICLELAKMGKTPICIDLFSTGHKSAVQFGPYIEVDLCDQERLLEAFLLYKPVAVIHAAGRSIVTESIQNPLLYYRNNVLATITLLEVMKQCNVKHLIFSSSASIYDTSKCKALKEEDPKHPLHPYGKSKWMIEEILSDLNHSGEIHSISLRYFNAAGAHGQIGEDHSPETHLIPITIQVALQLKECLEIRGIDFTTEDGSAERDYIHVEDLARAHLLALEALMSSRFTGALNLGSRKATSVLKIVSMIEARLGHVKRKISAAYGFEPHALVADSSLAQKVLGWEPEKSLEEIIDSAIAWQKTLYASSKINCGTNCT